MGAKRSSSIWSGVAVAGEDCLRRKTRLGSFVPFVSFVRTNIS
jgi:hypothetical protein